MAKRNTKKQKPVVVESRLEECLEKVGMSAYQLARALNKPDNFLTSLKRKGHDPRVSTLLKVAMILGCDLRDLIRVEGYEPTRRL